MIRIKKQKIAPLVLASLLAITLAVTMTPLAGIAAQQTVNLGTASSFGVLAGSTITNTGSTTISGSAGGNIGLHPGEDPTIGTFPGQEDITLSGTVHLFDAVAEQAKVDLVTAYNDAAGRTTDETIAADLGGRTLSPGVYTSASSIGIKGILTLDGGGDPNAVFIFQAGSSLITASNSEIRLINNAGPCQIFWQVGSSATLGTGSYFVGHILAMESITATTGADVEGQLLARNGAVTMDTNTITNDVCRASSSGSLSVTKDVQGSEEGMMLPDFELRVTGPAGFSETRTFLQGESHTWENLAPGVYTVSENRDGLSSEWTVRGEGTVQVTAGQTARTTITNEYEKGRVSGVEGEQELQVGLPKTGGSAPLLAYLGIVLFGISFSMWRKSH